MILWILMSVLSFPSAHGQNREIEYECGAHGRFEYCIDGVPGCVIGCHCHPGYYFDTDTKICEPNIKLTQNFRRHYDYPEPTRHYVIEETTTLPNAVDEKIDLITKDADDLGDWLYNQFFKTIENQVINETKDDGPIITRRSGIFDPLKKTSRRSHKSRKPRKKKKKKKRGRGLKSKLLRITENDSLFDASSDSTDSDDSSSSSSSRSSSSSSSDSSRETHKEKPHKDDADHKKIIVFNKRPRPPLPSFIFLPNMETPFFPPIGLPPPAMPMYPMVPVPPMMPQFPFSGQALPPCPDEGNNPTTITSNSTADNSDAKDATSEATATHAITSHDEPTTSHDTPTTEATSLDPNTDADLTITVDDGDEVVTGEPINALRSRPNSRGRSRNKIMQKLRDKLKRKNKLQNYFANEYHSNEHQSLEPPCESDSNGHSNCSPNSAHKHQKRLPTINFREEVPGLQDVDFKYLSQLIHKANLNKTRDAVLKNEIHMAHMVTPLPPPKRRSYFGSNPNEIFQLVNDLVNQQGETPNQHTYNIPQQYPYYVPHRKEIEDTNEPYYANLGRQIASMIRNIETNKDFDEVQETEIKSPSNPFFTGNSRSYWERSVRSPFKYLSKTYNKEKKYVPMSNENLFKLENQVAIAASTVPTLGLRELENIISKMEKAKSKLINKNGRNFRRAESSKSSFNVNLLSGNNHHFISKEAVYREHQNSKAKYFTYNHNTDMKRQNSPSPDLPSNLVLAKSLIGNFRRTKNVLPYTDERNNETLFEKIIDHSIVPTRKPKVIIPQRFKFPNHMESYTVLPLPMKPRRPTNIIYPFVQVTTTKPNYFQVSPLILNQKSFNYYPGNNNQYYFEKPTRPVKFPTFESHYKTPYLRRVNEPSYFHNQFLEYFGRVPGYGSPAAPTGSHPFTYHQQVNSSASDAIAARLQHTSFISRLLIPSLA